MVLQRVKNGLIRADDDRFARLAVLSLHANHVRGRERHFRIRVAVFAHPAVVENLAQVASAGIGQKRDDHIALLAIFRHAQRRGNAAAAGTAGENSFLLGEAARPDETLFVIDLDHVVQNREIHRGRENVFADSFHHVGVRLADVAGFRVFVEKRAERIDADHFYVRILFLQVPPRAADRAAGSHAANEVRDFPFRVLPNFGAGGAVVSLGIHRIFVLVRDR